MATVTVGVHLLLRIVAWCAALVVFALRLKVDGRRYSWLTWGNFLGKQVWMTMMSLVPQSAAGAVDPGFDMVLLSLDQWEQRKKRWWLTGRTPSTAVADRYTERSRAELCG